LILEQDLRAATKETGFFTESVGCNEVFRKNPVSDYPCVSPVELSSSYLRHE